MSNKESIEKSLLDANEALCRSKSFVVFAVQDDGIQIVQHSELSASQTIALAVCIRRHADDIVKKLAESVSKQLFSSEDDNE